MVSVVWACRSHWSIIGCVVYVILACREGDHAQHDGVSADLTDPPPSSDCHPPLKRADTTSSDLLREAPSLERKGPVKK